MDTKTITFRRMSLLLVAALLAAAPVCVALAGKSDHVEARELLKRGEIVPLARILDVVKTIYAVRPRGVE